MVVEFGRRLRVELEKLQSSLSRQRNRARTSDTVRMSLDSIRSVARETEGPKVVQTRGALAFARKFSSKVKLTL
jgi:hypothetical protein